MSRSFELYRVYDAADSLLYIGISLSAPMRLSQHRDKPWWKETARVSVEHLSTPDRREAEAVERAAIRDERPLHNCVGGRAPRRPATNKSILSPVDVALMLRKSTKTVIRWGEQGRLGDVTLTKGGHRRYQRDAVEILLAPPDLASWHADVLAVAP